MSLRFTALSSTMRIASPGTPDLPAAGAGNVRGQLLDERLRALRLEDDRLRGGFELPAVLAGEVLERPHDDRRPTADRGPAEAREELEAVEAGHDEVQDDGGRRLPVGRLEGILRGGVAHGPVAEPPQPSPGPPRGRPTVG